MVGENKEFREIKTEKQIPEKSNTIELTCRDCMELLNALVKIIKF